MNTKHVYVASKNSFNDLSIPLIWCTLKTYYEENSSKHHEFTWADPWIANYRTKEEILQECHKCPPSVFGFSVYVWNEFFFDSVAKEIKQNFPDCLIVYGGPQSNVKYNKNFFREKNWVDIVVPGDAYGEIVFKEVLDHYPITDYEDIPYIYYPDKDRSWHLSQKTIEKKSFKWPSNIYKAQEKYLLPYVGKLFHSSLETSRGCPYQCIYCDWGGGTYTKVVKKPFSTVLDEIDWLGANQVKLIGVIDANFGIYDIDLTITEHIVDVAKKYGYPKTVSTENAKNHLERTTKIKEMLIEQGLIDHHKISVQTIDEEIKNNIRRIDPPIEKQIESANYLRSKFPNLTIAIETIVGLPGDTYQKTLEQINLLILNGLSAYMPNLWILLPETPAFSPESREKFQIQTVTKTMPSLAWSLKPNFKVDPSVFTVSNDWSNNNVETVVGTYSYSKNDWVDMYLITGLAYANSTTAINDTLCVYMHQEHGVLPAFIQDYIYRNYVNLNSADSSLLLSKMLIHGYQTIHKWAHDNEYNIAGIDPNPAFPFYLSPIAYISLIALTNAELFYETICNDLAKKFNDPAIADLGIYLSKAVLDSEYDPTIGRTFCTKYNWLKYFQTKKLDQGLFTYRINDQDILINQKFQAINWHQYKENKTKQHEQYFYQALTTMFSKLSTTIELC